jgi:hypothetical protein
MDNLPVSTPVSETSFFNKNLLIIVLVFLLIFSFLGINILTILGNFIQTIMTIFGPLITQILSVFGYTTGVIINKSADLASDVTKSGIDIADGTLQSVGDLLIKASEGNVNTQSKQQLQTALSSSIISQNTQQSAPLLQPKQSVSQLNGQPQPDNTTNPIQKAISSGKTNWCLVGEYQGRRGCIQVSEQDRCLSGQIFPNQQMCMNPAMFSNTYHPLKSVKE